MTPQLDPAPTRRLPLALVALTAGAFGIGTTEFVIMGLLQQVAADLQVSIASAGLLISGYALGVFFGAPLLTAATARMPRKNVLLALMLVFTLGNLACAFAPNYASLMLARIVTSLAHGTFFGVGAVVATGLVAPDRKASAISVMFTGLTVATLLGVPAGAWLGLHFGWRATFWAVTAIGIAASAIVLAFVPRAGSNAVPLDLRAELAVLARAPVVLALATTALGTAGLFTVYTYIQPALIEVGGFGADAVSPILLVFGAGMIVGNVLGGRLADRSLRKALFGTLTVLALVLFAFGFAIQAKVPAVLAVGLLGTAAFAIVAPLQASVLHAARGGESLASSLNIGAFNLGNALGAWLGGLVIDHGPGLAALGPSAAVVTLAGLGIATFAIAVERHSARPGLPDMPAASCNAH
jgi:DHA1 family inner membrane transport protein